MLYETQRLVFSLQPHHLLLEWMSTTGNTHKFQSGLTLHVLDIEEIDEEFHAHVLPILQLHRFVKHIQKVLADNLRKQLVICCNDLSTSPIEKKVLFWGAYLIASEKLSAEEVAGYFPDFVNSRNIFEEISECHQ